MGGYAVRTAVGDVRTVVRVPKLEVRVSQERLAQWRRAAGEASLSAWVRDACDRAAGGGVAVPDVQRPAVPVVRRGERARQADAAVAALQGFGERPAASAPPVEEPVAMPPARRSAGEVERLIREACERAGHPARVPLGGGRARCRACKAEVRL